MKPYAVCLALGCLWAATAHAAPAFPLPHTGQKPQSKVWYGHGSWWAALGADGGVYLWKYQDGALVAQPGPLPDSRATDECDVLEAGNHLFVAAHRDGSPRVYKFEWADGAYRLLHGFPVTLSAGVETSTLALDSTGRLWLATARAAGSHRQIHVTWADGDHRKWDAAGVVIETGVSADDICGITAFGKQVGVFWSDQARDRFGFRVHQDGKPPGEWDEPEIVSDEKGIADDHLRLAADDQGRVWAVTKDSRDQFTLRRRNAAGRWDFRVPVPQRLGTRATVVLSDRQVFVAYTDWTASPRRIGLRSSPRDEVRFGEQSTVFAGPTAWNNVSGPKHPVDAKTGLLLIAGGKDRAEARLVDVR